MAGSHNVLVSNYTVLEGYFSPFIDMTKYKKNKLHSNMEKMGRGSKKLNTTMSSESILKRNTSFIISQLFFLLIRKQEFKLQI